MKEGRKQTAKTSQTNAPPLPHPSTPPFFPTYSHSALQPQLILPIISLIEAKGALRMHTHRAGRAGGAARSCRPIVCVYTLQAKQLQKANHIHDGFIRYHILRRMTSVTNEEEKSSQGKIHSDSQRCFWSFSHVLVAFF